MATEQEELRLQVTLVDNASAGLANLQKQLHGLATGQTVAGLEKMNKVAAETAAKLKGVKDEGEKAGGVTMAFARGIGLAAGAVAAFGYNLVSTLDKFAQAGVKLRVLSNETGLLPGQLKNIQDQMQQFGISTETANQNIKGFQTALADVVKNASQLRNKLMEEAGRDPQNQENMRALLRRVMGLGQAGETEEAMSEIIASTRDIIDNQIKAGASPALAAERGRQFLALWGMTPDVLSIIGPLKRASAEQLADAEKRLKLQEQYNTEMNKTNQQWDNFKAGLQEGILKTLSEINKEFGDTEALGKALAGSIQGIVEGVRTSAREIQAIINGVRSLIAIFTGTSGDKPEPSTMSGETGHGGAQGGGVAGGVQGLPGSPSGPSVRGNRSIQNDEMSPEAQERLRRKYRRGGGAAPTAAGAPDLAGELGMGALNAMKPGGGSGGGATPQRFAGGGEENKFVRWARENNAFSTNIEDRRGEAKDRTKNVSDLTFEIKRLTDFLTGKTTGAPGGAVGFMGSGSTSGGGGGGGGFGGIPGYGGPAGYSGTTPGGSGPSMRSSVPGYGPPGGGGPPGAYGGPAGTPTGAGPGMTPGAPGMRGGGPAGFGGGGGSTGYVTPPSAPGGGSGVAWPQSPMTGGTPGGQQSMPRNDKESEFYQKMLKAYEGSSVIGTVPKDGHLYGITTGSKEEWARFATSVAKAESGFNPKTDNPGDPGGSSGVFQYAHGQVPGGNAYNTDKSIEAFIRDSERSMKETGALRGDPMMRGGKKSWSGLLGARFSTIGNHPGSVKEHMMPTGPAGPATPATMTGRNMLPGGDMTTMPIEAPPGADSGDTGYVGVGRFNFMGSKEAQAMGINVPHGSREAQMQFPTGIESGGPKTITANKYAGPDIAGFLYDLHQAGAPLKDYNGAYVNKPRQHGHGNAVDIETGFGSGPDNSRALYEWSLKNPEAFAAIQAKHHMRNLTKEASGVNDWGHFEWTPQRRATPEEMAARAKGGSTMAKMAPGATPFLTGREGRITSGGWQDTYLDRKEMDRTLGKEITSKVEGEGKVTIDVNSKKADTAADDGPLKDIPIKHQSQMQETNQRKTVPPSARRTSHKQAAAKAAPTSESHDPSLDS